MSDSSLKILRRYRYDALDRLADVGLLADDSTQRFYQENHLVTELGQHTQRTILRHEAQPMAQQQSEAGVRETRLLATDQAHSLLHSLAQTNSNCWAYTAYGHYPAESGLSRLLGFNGECPDAVTGHYLLGRGKRAFNPVLMRFNSPDELGPFDERAGINTYAYCGGDPTNFIDPTGNIKLASMLRGRSIPTSVIVENPLHATRNTTSAITKNARQIALNPRLIAPLDQPVPSTSWQTPNTSVLASQEVPVPALRKTEMHAPKTTSPSIQSKNHRKLVSDGQRYDRHVNQSDYPPMAPREMVEKLKSAKQAFENANDREFSKTAIDRLAINYRMTELKVKAYVIRSLNTNIIRR